MNNTKFLHVLQPSPIYEDSYELSNFPEDFEKISNTRKKNLSLFLRKFLNN